MKQKHKAQTEVLHLLTDLFLTPQQIATRRKTSKQAVYNTIKKLREKGDLKGGFNKGFKNLIHPSASGLKNLIRLHGQEFNIKILYKDKKYEELLKRSNVLTIDGNTIRLYHDSIEIYGNNAIFYGKTEKEAHAQAMAYWFKYFNRIETELKILIVKDRSRNIRQVNAHYSEVNNELAKEANRTKEKISIPATEDNKKWAEMDHSYNLNEFETLHPETAKQDMGEVVRPFFNDLRDNKPPLLSDIMQILKTNVEINKETAAGLNTVVQLMKPREEAPRPVVKGYKPEYIG